MKAKRDADWRHASVLILVVLGFSKTINLVFNASDLTSFIEGFVGSVIMVSIFIYTLKKYDIKKYLEDGAIK